APISTHTEAGTMALEQVALLTGEGVPPEHIIIGHIDRRLDWDFVLALARTGVYFGFDQVSKEKYYPDALRITFIQRLVEAGHERQVLLSGDLARRSYWHTYNADSPGFAYIPTQFARRLAEAGLPESAITDLLVHNPAQALAFTPR
ncbi:MAG: phosphotriesterase-related protein, partial [Anaerolineae bacterium]|nr:phosphotriesterase-related protein [Anaerolineae bacterium]